MTLTTYRNLFLRNRHTSKPPVFLGPACVHIERQFQDYLSFFTTLLKLEPRISSLKAYGTDGEMALVNALDTTFPTATGLRCFIHKQGNIEDHLKGVPNPVKKELLHDIFRAQDGEVFSTGLVDVNSEEEFDV